jgi:hypothetical protein
MEDNVSCGDYWGRMQREAYKKTWKNICEKLPPEIVELLKFGIGGIVITGLG